MATNHTHQAQKIQKHIDRTLRLDDALKKADTMEGWSEARKRAYAKREENPNAYYYRFNDPGEAQRNGAWTQEEEKLFFDRMSAVGADGKWGIFSSVIPGRVGYQCSNFYRLLLEQGRIKDDRYVFDDKGKAHMRKGDGGIRGAAGKLGSAVYTSPPALSQQKNRTKRNRPERSSSDEEGGTSQPQLKRGKHDRGSMATVTTSPPNDDDVPPPPPPPPPPTALKLVVTTRDQDDQSRHATTTQTFLQKPQAALLKTVQDFVNLQEQLKAQAQTVEDSAAREVSQAKGGTRAKEIEHKHKLEELKRETRAQAQAAQKLQAERDQLQREVEKTKRINADLARSNQNALQAAQKLRADRDQLKVDNERLQRDLKAARASQGDWLAAIKPLQAQAAKSGNGHIFPRHFPN